MSLLLCLLPLPALADLTGPARVVDGDTIWVGQVKVRLHGIDTPERGQTCHTEHAIPYACGARATRELVQLIGDAPVRCVVIGDGAYGRVAGRCFANDRDLQHAMVTEGYARASVAYSRDYAAAERAARAAATGFWALNMQDPAAFRRTQRSAPLPDGFCAIKGNISRTGRIYHAPGQAWYDRTRIDENRGERWFCTPAAAEAAGWRPARR